MRFEFEGKHHIYGHHLAVPLSPLVIHPEKSVLLSSTQRDSDNLIIHGDNLYALKALMPRYAGRVDCVYIDPPYNTGNEGWVYNDNVNSPLLKQWLTKHAPVDGEDLERHDKWLCMMWPRLHLLRDLLSDDGVIFVSIDQNEQHHLRILMDEIFEERNFVNMFVWVNNLKGRQISGYGAAGTHEYVLVYAKDIDNLAKFTGAIGFLKNAMPSTYRNIDYEVQQDNYGEYVTKNELHNTNSKFNEHTRPNLVYDIYYNASTGDIICEDVSVAHLHTGYVKVSPKPNLSGSGAFHAWRWGRDKVVAERHNLKFLESSDGSIRIYTKVRAHNTTAVKDVITDISTTRGKKDLEAIFDDHVFDFPKPVELVRFLISFSNPDAVVLDSFAGSGTTAQAVIELNAADGGNRKFILIECEDYADNVTAERIRRVIQGIPDAKDENLRDGYSCSFQYCTLGAPLDVSSLLDGKSLPSYADMAVYVYHMATGRAIDETLIDPSGDVPFYQEDERDFWLHYRPRLDWLRSTDSGLTETMVSQLAKSERKVLVFASHKYISQRKLTDMGITFCQIPYMDESVV